MKRFVQLSPLEAVYVYELLSQVLADPEQRAALQQSIGTFGIEWLNSAKKHLEAQGMAGN